MSRLLVLLSLLFGCHSVALEPDPGASPPPGSPSGPGPTTTPPATTPPRYPADDVPGPSPLRRLTVLEYHRTLRDLVGEIALGTIGETPADYLPRTNFATGAWIEDP